ncbi:MAG TPA: CpsD/CapB family tyrosine-protein kinase [Rubrobacter sp.]|nr:CpsD/CapB family tyrosine-protein kinase [Rubrobacter sp.]
MGLEAVSGTDARRLLLGPDSPVRSHYEDLAGRLLSLGGIRSLVVTSPEPGAGRTSVCVGLAGAVAGMGRRVGLVDCNLGDPRLHRMLGEPNFVGLTSGLEGDMPLEHYGYEVAPGLLVVPAGPVPPDPVSRLEHEKFVAAVRSLEQGRDLVIVDGPVAGGVLSSPNLSEGFDGVLLVVHASRTPKSLARETIDDLLEAGTNLLGVVLNGCT